MPVWLAGSALEKEKIAPTTNVGFLHKSAVSIFNLSAKSNNKCCLKNLHFNECNF